MKVTGTVEGKLADFPHPEGGNLALGHSRSYSWPSCPFSVCLSFSVFSLQRYSLTPAAAPWCLPVSPACPYSFVKVGAGVWRGNREMWQQSFCYCHEHPRQSLYTERRFIMADIFGGPSLTISWPCCSCAYVRV